MDDAQRINDMKNNIIQFIEKGNFYIVIVIQSTLRSHLKVKKNILYSLEIKLANRVQELKKSIHNLDKKKRNFLENFGDPKKIRESTILFYDFKRISLKSKYRGLLKSCTESDIKKETNQGKNFILDDHKDFSKFKSSLASKILRINYTNNEKENEKEIDKFIFSLK